MTSITELVGGDMPGLDLPPADQYRYVWLSGDRYGTVQVPVHAQVAVHQNASRTAALTFATPSQSTRVVLTWSELEELHHKIAGALTAARIEAER